MTAEHEGADGARGAEGAEGAGEYGGMDALMAAITGDPLPEEAHRDPAFHTGHRAAQADVALLRDRLHWLAEALTGERASGGAGAGPAAAGEEGERSAGAGEPWAGGTDAGNTQAGDAGGGEGGARSADAGAGDPATGDAGDARTRHAGAGDPAAWDAGAGEPMAGDAGVPSAGAGGPAAGEPVTEGAAARDAGAEGAVAGDAEVREAGIRGARGTGDAGGAVAGGGVARRARGRTGPPGRPGRRAPRIALGSLAGAAAFSLVLGLGWLVTRSGGPDDGGGSAKSAADSAGKAAGNDGRPADAERELACSRLVVEGTVAEVRRLPDSPASRITLTVLRSYQPAHGPAEVGFLLDGGARPAPRTGQHVLVRVGRGEERASLWAVGDTQVATARTWITGALPGARHTPCP
ncbi:hypothetical protein [Streptomyces sp. AGS-58]|uniref:hypothetical protein n=1 Tax=unclassified Streptomyces TaxID=2593676 RepID=UPI0035A38C58